MENIRIATVNEWWKTLTMDVKSLITGIYDEDEADIFWKHLFVSDKQNIYQWRQAEAGNTDLCEDYKHSLLMEIVCELADIALVSEYGIPLDDMTDEDGSFYEEYQDRFNNLYDEIEDRLSTIK
ncbi:MAG: hypothetical protein EZS26_002506 [Candidatus Ordinivivax streblomastigis]|uniref:Uncharacterized protein n=1 Tax=Candidatus Ordinivivax streblomastigis TaxID=2540710 RepID=A0A5M8NYU1_9BACT|nr:MAG: hypothetical protein EZS26_002506 [Candidatus Ordinivivax streblomastigis]